MNKILLSFVIPIYQVEDYIEECLYSICRQNINTTDWFEIICVNDGSKDRSLDIARRIANEYHNILFKIVDKDNEGVSVARNIGIKNAEGTYLWFVDSDDAILQGALSLFYDLIKNSEYDLISALFAYVSKVEVAKDIYKGSNKNNRAFCSSCIRRKLLLDHEILFASDLTYGEDLLFFEMVNFWAEKSLNLPYVVYSYRQRIGSAMNSRNNQDKYISSLEKRLAIYTKLDDLWGGTMQEKNTYFADLRDGVVRNIMLHHVRQQDVDSKTLLRELISLGVYPYRYRFKELFKFYSLPDFIIKVFSFGFPCSLYYRFVSKCFSLYKKLTK